MNDFTIHRKLEALITLFVRVYPCGIRCLLGQSEFPDDEELNELIECMRTRFCDPENKIPIGSGQSVAEAARIIENMDFIHEVIRLSGGWAHIVQCVQEWRRCYPVAFGIVCDHQAYALSNFSKIDDSQVQRIAAKYLVSVQTVYKYTQSFSGDLARVILCTPVEELK